jgi:hypothetical protein
VVPHFGFEHRRVPWSIRSRGRPEHQLPARFAWFWGVPQGAAGTIDIYIYIICMCLVLSNNPSKSPPRVRCVFDAQWPTKVVGQLEAAAVAAKPVLARLGLSRTVTQVDVLVRGALLQHAANKLKTAPAAVDEAHGVAAEAKAAIAALRDQLFLTRAMLSADLAPLFSPAVHSAAWLIADYHDTIASCEVLKEIKAFADTVYHAVVQGWAAHVGRVTEQLDAGTPEWRTHKETLLTSSEGITFLRRLMAAPLWHWPNPEVRRSSTK